MGLKHIKSVVVVDDDPQSAEHLTDILKDEGIHVKSASNCLDLLLMVSEDIPDLFIIERRMPTISGERLCRVLRNQPRLANSYRVMLFSVSERANVDLEAMGAHACIARQPGKLLASNLIEVLQRLDETKINERPGV